MKRTTVILICICLLFCTNGCKNGVDDNHISSSLSVTKYSDTTGKYYEETANGYKAAFYQKSETNIERIETWLASCEPVEGYYQYIYSDPDSWDMFIYYVSENVRFGGSNFKFLIDDSTVKVYVINGDSASAAADYILIRIQAPFRGSWPNSSELYVNGDKIERQDGLWLEAH